jgi:PTS system mannose-specific IIA component
MVGLILFSHARLAEAFREVLQAVAGPQEQVRALGVDAKAGADVLERQLSEAIPTVDRGEGVVIVTDLFGGTPANFSLARMAPGKVEVLSGLNLAMLLKFVEIRQQVSDPVTLARAMAMEGRESVVLASEVLKSGSAGKAGR